MQRQHTFYPGEFYHVYNRGVEKRNIFTEKKDWERFQKLLYLANGSMPFRFRDIENQNLVDIYRGDILVAIGAYVLMPNHFHILVKEINQNGLSTFMEKLATGYSMYFNKKYERVGPLFQGRFKAEHVSRDEHLKYLYAYIHLNPVKLIEPKWKETGIKNKDRALKFIKQYHYSSYEDYGDANRQEFKILTEDEFPKYFSDTYNFKTYVRDWLTLRESIEKFDN
ncbi:MAG: transposase [Candidatus Yanofskybacteria bacterium]|nr:transposase [Candidatus Yanofskybacteria bacterium]